MTRHRFTALLLVPVLLSFAVVPLVAAQDEESVTLRVGLHADEKNLNPFITPQALPITHDFTMLVYDTLFWSQSRLDPEPWLAISAEPSEDYRTWHITLRDDVVWHDGTPLTADDVAYTFLRFAVDEGPGRYGHHVYDHPVFNGADVTSPTELSITFAEPVPTFKMLPGGDIPILPMHIWAEVGDLRADATSLPVGSGPYKMVEYNPGVSYRLEANPDYFMGPPLVDTLIMPVVSDAQAAFAGLQTGELDFVTRNLPAPLVPVVQANEELSVITGSRMQSLYLMFNTRKPLLSNPAVRKAMSMALDVQAIVDIVEGGLGRPGNDTWTHPDSPWAHPLGGHEFDLETAGAMLDAAGYPLGEGGVRRNAEGDALAFTLLVNAAAPPQIRSGELVAEQLSAIGVDVTVEPLDAPAISAARRPGPDGPPSVDMFIAVFESHAHADPDHLFFFFHTPGRGVGGVFSGYANPEFDAVVDAALSAPIEVKRELIAEAQEMFAAEAPAVVLYYPAGRWGYRPSAYDGWVNDPGHGVFTKRSFLEPYAGTRVPDTMEPGPVTDEPDQVTEDAEGTQISGSTEGEVVSSTEDGVTESDQAAQDRAAEGSEGDAVAESDQVAQDQAEDAADGTDDDGGSGGTVALVVVAVIALAVIAGIVVRRRRRGATVID